MENQVTMEPAEGTGTVLGKAKFEELMRAVFSL